jgi:hypothetical protein
VSKESKYKLEDVLMAWKHEILMGHLDLLLNIVVKEKNKKITNIPEVHTYHPESHVCDSNGMNCLTSPPL